MKKLFTALSLLLAFQAIAQDCLPAWAYYQDVSVENSVATELTDFQVSVVINTAALVSAGKLNADGSDLRFTLEDCTLLPYFMDSLATSTNNMVWIKMPVLQASATTNIRMYYGNPDAAPYANGDETFEFFDDFSSGMVDPAKWEAVGLYNTLEVVDGVLNYASEGTNPGPRFKFVRTATTFSEPMIFEFAAEVSNSNGFGFSSADVALERILFRQAGFGFDTLNQVAFMEDTISNGYQVEGLFPFIRWPRNVMQDGIIAAGVNTDGKLQINQFDNVSNNSVSTDTYVLEEASMTGFHFILSSFINFTVYLDYIRVRKPATEAPVLTPDEETNNPLFTSVRTLYPAGSIAISPNPSYGLLELSSEQALEGELLIFNALGQQVHTQQITLLEQDRVELNVSQLQAGVYTVAVLQPGGSGLAYSERLVIMK